MSVIEKRVRPCFAVGVRPTTIGDRFGTARRNTVEGVGFRFSVRTGSPSVGVRTAAADRGAAKRIGVARAGGKTAVATRTVHGGFGVATVLDPCIGAEAGVAPAARLGDRGAAARVAAGGDLGGTLRGADGEGQNSSGSSESQSDVADHGYFQKVSRRIFFSDERLVFTGHLRSGAKKPFIDFQKKFQAVKFQATKSHDKNHTMKKPFPEHWPEKG